MANPFHVPNASMGQAYYLGPQAMDPRAPTLPAATQFRGHVVSPGMLGVDGLSYHPGIQEGPTMMIGEGERFKYRVKVINPKAKESIVIDWHGIKEKFVSVADLKEKLVNTLGAHLPELSDEFNIGYFHGRPQTKSWILSEHDLRAMYATGSKEILLWCDGKSQDTSGKKRKKTNDDEEEGDEEGSGISKRTKSASAEEKELEEGIHKLQSIHSGDYDYGQYRLWARLIKNNQWKDFNNPPNLPMITGKVSHKEKGGNAVTVVDTLATAAVAIIKELKKDPTASASTNKRMCTPALLDWFI